MSDESKAFEETVDPVLAHLSEEERRKWYEAIKDNEALLSRYLTDRGFCVGATLFENEFISEETKARQAKIKSPTIQADSPCSYHDLILLWAIQHNHLHVFAYLIEHGKCDLHKTYGLSGMTALHLAAQKNQLRIIQYLAEKCNFDFDVADIDGNTALHYAALNGDWKMIIALITEFNLDPRKTNKDGERFTDVAIKKVAYSSLLSGILPTLFNFIDLHPLQEEENEAAALLLMKLTEHTLQQSFERYAYLLQSQRVPPASLARTHSLGIERKEEDLLALLWAAEQGQLALFAYILEEKKFDYHEIHHQHGITAVYAAACGGHWKIIQYLSDRYNVDLCQRDHGGNTAVYLAAKGGHLAVVKALIGEFGAHPNTTDGNLGHYVHYALKKSHRITKKNALLTLKKDLNTRYQTYQNNKETLDALRHKVAYFPLDVLSSLLNLAAKDVSVVLQNAEELLNTNATDFLNSLAPETKLSLYELEQRITQPLQAPENEQKCADEEGSSQLQNSDDFTRALHQTSANLKERLTEIAASFDRGLYAEFCTLLLQDKSILMCALSNSTTLGKYIVLQANKLSSFIEHLDKIMSKKQGLMAENERIKQQFFDLTEDLIRLGTFDEATKTQLKQQCNKSDTANYPRSFAGCFQFFSRPQAPNARSHTYNPLQEPEGGLGRVENG